MERMEQDEGKWLGEHALFLIELIWHNPGFEHCTPRLDLTRLRSLF